MRSEDIASKKHLRSRHITRQKHFRSKAHRRLRWRYHPTSRPRAFSASRPPPRMPRRRIGIVKTLLVRSICVVKTLLVRSICVIKILLVRSICVAKTLLVKSICVVPAFTLTSSSDESPARLFRFPPPPANAPPKGTSFGGGAYVLKH